MGDNDYIIIVPLSAVGIAFFAFIFTGLSAVYSIKLWFEENFTTILIVAGIIAIAVAIILWCKKDFSVALSSLFGVSQLIFFVIYGGLNLSGDDGFAIIWTTILFLLYAVVALVNIVIYLLVNFLSILGEKCDNSGIYFNLFYGGAGWALNLIVVWAVTTS